MTDKVRRVNAKRGLYSHDQLRAILARERGRADRNGHEFSFVVFDMGDAEADNPATHRLVEALICRVRSTDEAGWFDEQRLGVVLPDTPTEGAWKLADDICQMIAATAPSPVCMVYTYPSQWFLDDNGDSSPPQVVNTPTTAASSQLGILRPRGFSQTNAYTASAIQSNALLQRDGKGRAAMALEPLWVRRMPAWKRGLDIVGSLLGIILTAPMMAIIAIIIKLTSPGAIIFKQNRIGYGGRPFTMYKFRSMISGCGYDLHAKYTTQFIEGRAETNNDGVFKLKDDRRVTPVGKFIRKWSLDELPQFFNVLKGEMSLVGPRPYPWYARAHYSRWHRRRTIEAKPGITGLWQVEGRGRVTFEEMVRMDIRYGQSLSFMNDLKLIFRTFKVVLCHTGAY